MLFRSGATTLGNTLSVAGASTMANVSAGNVTASGTLNATGATTLNSGLTSNGTTTVNGAVNVSGALTAGSVASGGVTLADVSKQITAVANFTTNNQGDITAVTLKAVDATNATVSTQAGNTTVGAVAGSTSATSAFLDFFRRLFGGGN